MNTFEIHKTKGNGGYDDAKLSVPREQKPFFSFQNRKFKLIVIFGSIVSLLGILCLMINYTAPYQEQRKDAKPLNNENHKKVETQTLKQEQQILIEPNLLEIETNTETKDSEEEYPFITNSEENLQGKRYKDKFGNTYRIVNEFRRNQDIFVEGLSWVSTDKLLESSGFQSKAGIQYLYLDRIRNVIKPSTFEKLWHFGQYFGEGSDVFLDKNNEYKVFQQTWHAHKIFQYDMDLKKQERTFTMTDKIPYGWAMTRDWDDHRIAYIDTGDEYLYICDSSKDFELINKVPIMDKGEAVKNINEIEYVDKYIYGNKWMTTLVYKLATDGTVVNKFDFEPLYQRAHKIFRDVNHRNFKVDDCLNGIAYDKERGTFYLTGKNWRILFEIKIEQ